MSTSTDSCISFNLFILSTFCVSTFFKFEVNCKKKYVWHVINYHLTAYDIIYTSVRYHCCIRKVLFDINIIIAFNYFNHFFSVQLLNIMTNTIR